MPQACLSVRTSSKLSQDKITKSIATFFKANYTIFSAEKEFFTVSSCLPACSLAQRGLIRWQVLLLDLQVAGTFVQVCRIEKLPFEKPWFFLQHAAARVQPPMMISAQSDGRWRCYRRDRSAIVKQRQKGKTQQRPAQSQLHPHCKHCKQESISERSERT